MTGPDPAEAVEPVPHIRVTGGRRHVIYNLDTDLVRAICGDQLPLNEWQTDNPGLPACVVCGWFMRATW